jgi:hypothetical protein
LEKRGRGSCTCGKPNPFDRFKDKNAKGYIRSRYFEDKDSSELLRTPEVENLERLLASNLPAY